jgi:hypothetical protein
VAKRALEGLLHKMRELTCTLGIQDLLYLGTLKHRDLAGNAVGSQVRSGGWWGSDNDVVLGPGFGERMERGVASCRRVVGGW